MMWLFLLFFVPGSLAALPACKPGVTSPPGGLWSEWALSGAPNCTTTCGSCSKLFYTRKCLSQRAGYPCIGETTRISPCNTHACVYPAQRTCCNPYVPMLINGSLQCGPLPKDMAPNTSPCCPTTGLWTQWSKFARNEDETKWIRTRECSSQEAGCPCSGNGSEEQVVCPCSANLDAAKSCGDDKVIARLHRALDVTDSTCTAVLRVEASNDHWEGTKQISYCRWDVGNAPFVPALRFLYAPSENIKDCANTARPFDCESRPKEKKNETLPISFTCDLESLYWRYDYTGALIRGYTQLSFEPT